jgi:hypothetical protein
MILKGENSTMPKRLRGKLWVKLFDTEQAQEVHSPHMYSKLLEFSNEEAESMISKDVSRTLSELKMWREDM